MDNITIRAVVRRDVKEAMRYYDEQRAGLGAELEDEFFRALDRIAAYPFAYQVIVRDVRHVQLARFSYHVLFRVVRDRPVVIALMHARRDPAAWQSRR